MKLLKTMKKLLKTRPKYGNKKVERHGIKFDSEREADRYEILLDAQSRGVIDELKIRPKWILLEPIKKEVQIQLKTKVKVKEITDQRAVTYTADFSYMKDGELVVEDVKINPYLLPKEYVLKEKMMYSIHGIKIHRVYNPGEAV